MTANTTAPQPLNSAQWYIYIVECSDKTYYTGVTTDIPRRLHEHNNTIKGAKYTRCRRPVRLIYFEESDSRQNACKREYVIKKMQTSQKKTLVQLFNKSDQSAKCCSDLF
ncbi:GIY-YIG nuclease family protein [Desulforhopalus sp. 52FAK]